jgi:HD-like signal output (HDOD) protein
VETASRPDLSLDAIAEIIHQDPAMTAKVLQVVNSAAFGSQRSVESVDQAVIYLGIELIKNLILTVHIFDTAPEAHVPGFSYPALREHAVLTARVAKRLMPPEGRPQHIFSAGLLHDIGYIVLGHSDPVSFRAIVEESLRSTRPLKDVEKEMLGVTHAEIGAYLLGLWGLPYPIVEGVAFHHDPAGLGEPGFGVPAALNVADALINEMVHGAGPRGHNNFDIDYLRAIGADSELRHWRTIAAAEVVAHRERHYA